MSTRGELVTLDDFHGIHPSADFVTQEWVSDHTDIDADSFTNLDNHEQLHILWNLSRDVPFRYANHAHHGKMRRYLAGGVVPRCNAPTILFRTFPHIVEFRQRKGRAFYEYTGQSSKIFVDFSVRSSSSEYGVKEDDVAHELMHTILRANGYRMRDDAYTRDGRTDRAWYHNGGYPHWDFGGKDAPVDTYYLRDFNNTENPAVGDPSDFDRILSERIDAYDADGLVAGADDDHAPTTRPDPFADDTTVDVPESDDERLRRLVREANLAWYTTAVAFSRGYEEFARNAFFKDEYTATNPDEFLCVLHEFLQSPGNRPGTTRYLVQARERHPWLLKRYLDVFQPHPDKQQNLNLIL